MKELKEGICDEKLTENFGTEAKKTRKKQLAARLHESMIML